MSKTTADAAQAPDLSDLETIAIDAVTAAQVLEIVTDSLSRNLIAYQKLTGRNLNLPLSALEHAAGLVRDMAHALDAWQTAAHTASITPTA